MNQGAMHQTETYTLSNGIRLIHQEIEGAVGYCGLFIHTGARDEKPEEHGMAHFIEHMLFKGTQKRKAFQILSRMDNVGGDINAYTTKEETCIHTAFLNKDFPRALELISDIVFHSSFPSHELEKEKEVIIDEINSYRDNPSEYIFDEFDEVIFGNSPLGRNILGTEESVKSFSHDDIQRFITHNYFTGQMVISTVGNVSFKRLIKWAERYFGMRDQKTNIYKRKPSPAYSASYLKKEKNTHQAHCIIGNTGYAFQNGRRPGLILLNNILGGPGLNSRLNMSLREKYGYAYNVESNYSPYTDTGIVSIYFGTEKRNLEKSRRLVYREFDRLRQKKLGVQQLKQAREQLKGQMAIFYDNPENRMMSFGKNMMSYGSFESLESWFERIDSITAEEILDIAGDILDEKKLSELIYV